MALEEIVLPETKPETEWVRGRALQKVSPRRTHSRIQSTLIVSLGTWAHGRGEIGVEWRFRLIVPGEARRPLVPDVSFVSNERLRGHTFEELEAPEFAPNVAIEILSPGDKRIDVESKIDVYLQAGSDAVIVFDPKKRTVSTFDRAGSRTFSGADTFVHDALPGFTFAVEAFFEMALRLPG
jgi:Uma2 family endonuclease